MLIKKPAKGGLRKMSGFGLALSVIVTGLTLTATYGYAEEGEKRVVKKEVIKTDGDGEKERRVIIMQGGDTTDIETMVESEFGYSFDDSEQRVMRIHMSGDAGDGEHVVHTTHQCAATEGEPEHVKLEWTQESDDGETIEKSMICVNVEDAADPDQVFAKLKSTIDNMEADAKKKEEKRKRMIAGLRAELRKMEKENRR